MFNIYCTCTILLLLLWYVDPDMSERIEGTLLSRDLNATVLELRIQDPELELSECITRSKRSVTKNNSKNRSTLKNDLEICFVNG